ncbi:hypothetical protein AXF42_Ash011933 [Apostasia shenzhenica]|uniref:Uncharacterized protein n=1 Tax=Apostasia shenzhenica TaxID=1088818 RepID=A0A2I0AW88_9ASPA|nr:hypothetical protein AXF42_Ash011933 [Apostasia shenzhenica]
MLQSSRIPRRSTNIKRYRPPFAAAGLPGGRQTTRTQCLSITFPPKNQDGATHPIVYKYR